MPAKYSVKLYRKRMYYHIYNRGANKALVYQEESDYRFFRQVVRQELRAYFPDVSLVTFCLMPNHFHFLLYLEVGSTLPRFMKSVGVRYSMYFNKKYAHSGRLFQGVYKGVSLKTWARVRKVQEYILNNPLESGLEPWEHVGWII